MYECDECGKEHNALPYEWKHFEFCSFSCRASYLHGLAEQQQGAEREREALEGDE